MIRHGICVGVGVFFLLLIAPFALEAQCYQLSVANGSSMVLDIYGNGTSNGTPVDVATPNGTSAQIWQFSNGGSAGQIVSTNGSALVLDVYGNGTMSGTPVDVATANGTTAQQWTLSYNGTNYQITSGNGSGLVLDVYGNGTSNGTPVDAATPNGTTAQNWNLVQVSCPSGTIGTLPVPPPPTPCADCGLNFVSQNSGANPQFVLAPSSTNTLYAVCYNYYGNYVPCNVGIVMEYYQDSNGHFHGANSGSHPVSSVSPATGYTGNYSGYQMPITVSTTQVGQMESIEVQDFDNTVVTNTDYAVGYSGLVYLGNSSIFSQIGGNTTGHGDNTWNHYMTVNAANGIQIAATYYINHYNAGQKVCINDMALPIGGTFDITQNWAPPHKAHSLGTAVDVADVANQCTAAYVVNPNLFLQTSIRQGGASGSLSLIETGHVHVQWTN